MFKNKSLALILGCVLLSFSSATARPLYEATDAGNLKKMQKLINEGADVNEIDEESGHAPIHQAVQHEHETEYLDLLMKHGADVNIKTIAEGYTPLHVAMIQHEPNVMARVIGYGADVNAQDKSGRTPLFMLDPFYDEPIRKTSIIRQLLDKGAATDVRDERGKTPLHVLIRTMDLHGGRSVKRVVKLLVDRGAPIDAPDSNGLTPLWVAANRDKNDAAEFLIEKGANVNAQNLLGETVLHQASRMGSTDLVAFLIKNGAKVNAKNLLDETPLHVVLDMRHKELVTLLLENGADVTAQNHWGETPHRAALNQGYGDIPVLRVKKDDASDRGLFQTGFGLADIYRRAKNRGWLPQFLKRNLTNEEKGAKIKELLALRNNEDKFKAAVAKLRRRVKRVHVDETLQWVRDISADELPIELVDLIEPDDDMEHQRKAFWALMMLSR